jgi:hypothetical protein
MKAAQPQVQTLTGSHTSWNAKVRVTTRKQANNTATQNNQGSADSLK